MEKAIYFISLAVNLVCMIVGIIFIGRALYALFNGDLQTAYKGMLFTIGNVILMIASSSSYRSFIKSSNDDTDNDNMTK